MKKNGFVFVETIVVLVVLVVGMVSLYAFYNGITANIEKREQEQFEKTKAEALAKMEPVIKKVYYNIELKPVGDDGSGIYNFYIDPVAWVKLPYDKKEEAFKSCATYALLKSGFGKDKMNAVKVSTKILSSSNKAVLAQYTILKGIQVK